MAETTVEFTCPRCRYAWYVDLDRLETFDQQGYKGSGAGRRRATYRIYCTRCGNPFIVEVEEEGDA